MAVPDEEVHIRDTEATAASRENVGRWVLIFSTLIAIVLLGAVALFGGLSQDTVEEEATVSSRIQSVEDENTDDGVLLGEEAGAADLGEDQVTDTPAEVVPNEREQ